MAARARELDEENEREKGAREAAVKTAKEKAKIAEAAERKAAEVEKFRASAEKGVQTSWPSKMRRNLS